MSRSYIVIIAAAVLIAVGITVYFTRDQKSAVETNVSREELAAQAIVDVVLPDRLSAREQQGRSLFNENCSACHGVNAAGSDNGPPLVHRLYEPGHHSDQSFVLAAERGVKSHHWQFGDMLPREDVSRAEVAVIVSYVRALQRANGIR